MVNLAVKSYLLPKLLWCLFIYLFSHILGQMRNSSSISFASFNCIFSVYFMFKLCTSEHLPAQFNCTMEIHSISFQLNAVLNLIITFQKTALITSLVSGIYFCHCCVFFSPLISNSEQRAISLHCKHT